MSMKCVSHDKLMQDLIDNYKKGDAVITVVHGPYSVGKTYIGQTVAKACKGLYVLGRKANEAIHVDVLHRVLGCQKGTYQNIQEILTHLVTSSMDTRRLLVIDDYPSLVESVPQVPLILRDILTAYESTQLRIILMGHDVDQLNGRILGRTSLIASFIGDYYAVEPLTLDDVKSLGWEYSDDELAVVHTVTHGLPANLRHFNPNLSVDDNIVNLFFTPSGGLFHETQRILQREIRNITAANSILGALAQMNRPLFVELNNASQVKSGTFTTRLSDLLSMRIVRRVNTHTRGLLYRHVDYQFENTFFEFWYRHVFPYLENIHSGDGESIYYDHVKPQLFA